MVPAGYPQGQPTDCGASSWQICACHDGPGWTRTGVASCQPQLVSVPTVTPAISLHKLGGQRTSPCWHQFKRPPDLQQLHIGEIGGCWKFDCDQGQPKPSL